MLFPSVLSRLLLAMSLLALSKKIHSAPTHHLTIGVQGNTPTLMVTSSEIGITAQTMNYNKKSAKVLYAAKASKDLDVTKKPVKAKSNKNSSLNNKKDKLQYLTKSHFKHEENAPKLTTSLELNANKLETLKQIAKEPVLLRTTASIEVSNSPESVQIYETNLQSTALPPKLVNEMPLPSSIITQTTTKRPEDISTSLPPAITDASAVHFAIANNDDLNISPAVSTTFSPKDFATLYNNNDDTNTAATKHTPTQTPTTTRVNTVASQTHQTTQISTETSITKLANEFDSDRYTQTSIATRDNENRLLTTTESNAFTTPTAPAEISAPSTATSETYKAEPTSTQEVLVLSLITTTTESTADDNNNGNSQGEQHQPTATKKSHEYRNVPVESEAGVGSGKKAGIPMEQNYQRGNVLIKSRQVYDTHTKLEPHLFLEEAKSTETPSKRTKEKAAQEAASTATKGKSYGNKIETAPTAATEKITSEQYLQTTAPAFQATSATTDMPATKTEPASVLTTTETILKLIDLEKHALKTIDELNQPAASMVTQHDNGHDGLKTTKKKQLIDKHYLEALLHQKQDTSTKNLKDFSATTSSQVTLRHHMPFLEHGSLGPILMQEKTFHVIHHSTNAQKVRNPLKEDINIQLKRGHFVELKAQPALNEDEKNKSVKSGKGVNSSRDEEGEIGEIQSDQPGEDLNQQNEEHTEENKNSGDLSTRKEISLDLVKPNSFKITEQQKQMEKRLNNSRPNEKAADETSESTDLKLKPADTNALSESTPTGENTQLLLGEHAKETNKEMPPPAFEKQQQHAAKKLSTKTANKAKSKLLQDKSLKMDHNSSQLIKNPESKQTAGATNQQNDSQILLRSGKISWEEANNRAIQKPNISKITLDTPAEISFLKLKQNFSESKTSSLKNISVSMYNTNKNETLGEGLKSVRMETFNVSGKGLQSIASEKLQLSQEKANSASVLSTTVFQVIDSSATKTPMVQAETLFTAPAKEKNQSPAEEQQIESKISDIQIEVYDSTIDSIVASTNFKDNEAKQQSPFQQNDENYLGKTTKPPTAAIQQERFTQYVIDRTETSTHEPINYNTIKVAAGKPEPAAIEIHINVSESFGNESEDLEFSYPQTDFINGQQNEKAGEELYDDNKVSNNIKLKIPSNLNNNANDTRNDEILVVEIIDTENNTSDRTLSGKNKIADELFITDVKHIYTTPPPPPPPPPFQTNFDRDSDTIFYISNTEVKVGESLPSAKNTNEERKLKLESQFFPANYMASTHPNFNNNEGTNPHPNHHLYEEDIILSSNRNQADSLKIYRNSNEPSPPLDVTYVGESIIEVEQSPDAAATTTYAADQIRNVATPQTDVIIQPAILPEISIGVPVIGELPPQIELKEIDFMPNEAQLRRSGIYDDNDNSNNNDLDENTITGSSSSSSRLNNNHDVDIVSGNSNSNQHIDESSIQYGGDLIDESADGGFDGVEGSYPFGNPALLKKSFLSSSSPYSTTFLAKLHKQQPQQQQPNHIADYAHLYVNYGVNNMRKDELTADVKDSGEMFSNGNVGNGNANVASNEQNSTSFKDFLSKVSMSNASIPFASANATQNERMSNATAFSVMEDANDFDDKNTENLINLISLAIGLFIVILPVVVTCSMFWALRYLYKKYHSNLTDNPGYGGTEGKVPLTDDGAEKGQFFHETSSSPTNSHKDTIEKYPDTSNKPSTTDSSVKFSSEKPMPNIETSSCNTNASLAANYPSAIASQKTEALKLSLALSSPITQKYAKPLPTASSPLSKSAASEQTHYERDDIFSEERDDDDVEMPGPNGSITKMTLENNLLIVETEERNDISRVARETKMDYNKDGVFVVEVARGIDSKTIPESPVAEGNEKMLSMFDTKQNNGGTGYKVANERNCSNNEKVQIHSPPAENQEEGPRSLHQIEEVEEPVNSPYLNESNNECNGLAYKANTGLSQSDLSTTSSSDSNKGYCYGNQELYVVEQKGYSPTARNENVALKCDIKDFKGDDHNPGNDHYLKHSPDKRGDLDKDREDAVETLKKSEEGQSRTSSGESPEPKQNDKTATKNDDNTATESHVETLETKESESASIETKSITNPSEDLESKKEVRIESPSKQMDHTTNISIPVEIEVHIIPAPIEDTTNDETLTSNQTTKEQKLEEFIKSAPQPLMRQDIDKVLSDSPNEESSATIVSGNCSPIEIDLHTPTDTDHAELQNDAGSNITEDKENGKHEHLNIDNTENSMADEQYEEKRNTSGKQAQQEERIKRSLHNSEKEKEEPLSDEQADINNKNQIARDTDDQAEAVKIQDDERVQEAGSPKTPSKSLELNGVSEIEKSHKLNNAEKVNGILRNQIDETEFIEDEEGVLNGLSHHKQIEPILEKVPTTVEHTETGLKKQLLNGCADTESEHNSSNEIANGYDSIMSLPEPPPTTDEQLNSDLTEQQLDSLPPPPPPEVFSLKDLPPPLTNGHVDSPQSEDSNSFYNTLPPPPPTTLDVTVSADTTTTSNGKVHASPLTPPASPPAHFTNNLHAGLCSQPIAVDVNGS